MTLLPVIIYRPPTQRSAVDNLVSWCRELDGTVAAPFARPEPTGLTYPGLPNWSFKQVAKHMKGKDFFWLEADSVPLRKGWLAAITAEWQNAKRYGCHMMWTSDYNAPHDRIGGIGVFSGEIDDIIPDGITHDGFDGWVVSNCMGLVHRTPLIQHHYAWYKTNGDIERHHDFPPDLGVIRPDAVIFHKDAKQQLIQCVKEGMV